MNFINRKMKPIIKIAIIGGTGKSGRFLIKQLALKNIAYKALIRNPEDFETYGSHPEIIKGNITDYGSVLMLLKDCDAVISMLGMGKSANSTNVFSNSTKNIIRAMHELGIKRYIVTTGLNVNTPFDNKGVKSEAATEYMLAHYPETTLDKQKEYAILAKSDIDWTMIRLPMIQLTGEEIPIDISLEDCPGDSISATSLALFVIEQLQEDTFIKKAPFIANI